MAKLRKAFTQNNGMRSYVLQGSSVPAPALEPGLHVVATPIGHLEDITLRALKTLAGADIIACEDTRVSAKLLQRYAIRRPLVPYHEHNAKQQGAKLLERLNAGETVALICDAGTPLLSDPGARLVADAVAAGHRVIPIPGASALLAALVASGLSAERFHFIGFLPPKSTARRKALKEISSIPGTLVFYETAPRLAASLADMAEILGNRACALCRELTKIHETILRGSLGELALELKHAKLKGEIVLVVGARGEEEKPKADIDSLLIAALKASSLKEAVANVAKQAGAPRREVYAAALRLKGKR